MEYEVIFDTHFFNSLSDKWLDTREIYLLLTNIEELLSNQLIYLSNNMTKEPSNGDYYLIHRDMINIWKTKYNKETVSELKVSGLTMIKCHYSISSTLQRRIYYIIKQPKYAFVHYRQVKQKKRRNFNLQTSAFKIISYSPDCVIEDCSNINMLIVIETEFSNDYLSKNIRRITVGFGSIYVPVQLIAFNVLECQIPPQNSCEVIIDLYFNNKKASIHKVVKTFRYISNNLFNCNPFSFFDQAKKYYKENCQIFSLTKENLISRILSLIKHLKSEIASIAGSYNNRPNDINISQLEIDFNEENLNMIISRLYNELNHLFKTNLLNSVDKYGYNLLHYTCSLNLSATLQLLNYYKISLETKSNDNLTAYEICAGKTNLACLEKLINIIESHDINEENEVFDVKERCLYDVDVLKSALNLSLEKKNVDLSDIKVIDLLIQQIKIKYTVDSTSGNIAKHIDNKTFHQKLSEENKVNKEDNIQIIQKSVRGWLRRNKYKQLKNKAENLINLIKNYSERKRFLNKRQSTIFIQNKIRKWLKLKHISNRKNKTNNNNK